MALSLYIDRPSWVHALHPGVRAAGMVVFFLSAFLGERPLAELPLLAGVAGLLAWSGTLGSVHRLRYLFGLMFVMTFLIWTLFYGPDGGPPLASAGPIVISRTAPWFALGMATKMTVILGAGILFLSSTRIEDFAYALTRVGVPYKLGFTMTMAFRLVPVFLDSAASVVQAQRCRGLDFDRGGLWQRLRRYIPVIVPVFMGALRRADGMAMALEARGFQSRRPRTTFRRYPFGRADVLALAALAALGAAYVVLWRMGALRLV